MASITNLDAFRAQFATPIATQVEQESPTYQAPQLTDEQLAALTTAVRYYYNNALRGVGLTKAQKQANSHQRRLIQESLTALKQARK